MVRLRDSFDLYRNDRAAPAGNSYQLLCHDQQGEYELPFPCRYVDGVWLNCGTGDPIRGQIVGWRVWPNTTGVSRVEGVGDFKLH